MTRAMMDSAKEQAKMIPYAKCLGWKEYGEHGGSEVVIAVVDAYIGFNIIRRGRANEFLGWFESQTDAVEFAVDIARDLIAKHELSEVERERE